RLPAKPHCFHSDCPRSAILDVVDSWQAVLVANLIVTGGRVLVLSFPIDVPHQELLVSMTFEVVILLIVVHGLTMSPLLRCLGIARGQQERAAYELTHGKSPVARAALREIDQLAHVHFTNPEVLASLLREYEQKVERDRAALDELSLERQMVHTRELQRGQRHLESVEKDMVVDVFHRGLLGRAVQEKLLAAEMTARMGRDPGELYRELTREFGEPFYDRVEAPATQDQKERLTKLSSQQVTLTELAGETIQTILTHAAGNGSPIWALSSSANSGVWKLAI
ncbi:MAG: hypothetical protein ABI988_11180, partial [Nitrospirota bacterium]